MKNKETIPELPARLQVRPTMINVGKRALLENAQMDDDTTVDELY
ncbi:hypothetical protein [uncultured Desulfobacter sp.]|nr:hypothetical protein [uncultured Desulfobacter sp.]